MGWCGTIGRMKIKAALSYWWCQPPSNNRYSYKEVGDILKCKGSREKPQTTIAQMKRELEIKKVHFLFIVGISHLDLNLSQLQAFFERASLHLWEKSTRCRLAVKMLIKLFFKSLFIFLSSLLSSFLPFFLPSFLSFFYLIYFLSFNKFNFYLSFFQIKSRRF